MSSTENDGLISTSINAGQIKSTGNGNSKTGHQLRMGYGLFIHITPDVAQQWIDVLTPIAKEAK
jgi:hypothetical protein